MTAATFTREDVARAAGGDRAEMRRVLAAVVPAVRVRVTRVLWRYRGLARKRNLEQEAEDLAQEVLVTLFEKDGHVLRSWDPERGLSLVDFASFVADRTAAAVLKSGARTPWRDDPVEPSDLAMTASAGGGPDDLVVTREFGRQVLLALQAELSPLGARIFQRLFVDEIDVEVVCSELAMNRDAVYAWRSRLRRRMQELAEALQASPEAPLRASVRTT
jgi:RNA polymerase sigma-70 factor (ECF subfamily)